MKYSKQFVHLFVFILLLIVTYNIEYHPFIIDQQQFSPEAIANVSSTENKLMSEIKQKGAEFNEAPKNAYIDKVWKKTPGRNGIKVNLKKSYKKMNKNGDYKESLLVFDPISPETSLGDLPPSPIFRGHPEKNMVAFLINVSWGTEHIPEILNILNDHGIKATFFLEGKWAKVNVDYVKMIDEQDHIIGNHAYSHPDMSRLSKQEITNEIEQTNNIIKAIIGKTPAYFAPPSGDFTNEVVEVADGFTMETILWTVDTVDWKNPSVSVMMDRVVNNIHPGATILMHPTPSIVKGLDSIIEEIKSLGYNFGTTEKLLSEER